MPVRLVVSADLVTLMLSSGGCCFGGLLAGDLAGAFFAGTAFAGLALVLIGILHLAN